MTGLAILALRDQLGLEFWLLLLLTKQFSLYSSFCHFRRIPNSAKVAQLSSLREFELLCVELKAQIELA